MADTKFLWWRDFLLIPLVVGLIIAVFIFGLPKIFEKGKQLSYEIDGPTTYLDKRSIGNVPVTVDGVPISILFSYKVRLWNSGDQPLKNLPVLVLFETELSGFKIFSVRHETQPPHEFGNIKQLYIDQKSKKLIFDLLNPEDQDTISLLTNNSVPLKLYAKLEGLKVIEVKLEKPEKATKWWGIASTFLAIIASLLTVFLSEYLRKLPQALKISFERMKEKFKRKSS
jgi:hypothetical protein